MLETLRKHHYVLMLCITVVVIIAFVFLYDPNGRKGAGGITAFRMYGQNYSIAEREEMQLQQGVLGQLASIQELFQQRGAPRTDALMAYAKAQMMTLPQDYQDRSRGGNSPADFAINTVMLREEAKRLGVEVSTEDVQKEIQKIPAFQENGAFSKAAYDRFLGVGEGGARPLADNGEKILVATVRDAMLFQRIEQVLGLPAAKSVVDAESEFEDQNVTTTVSAVVLERKAFENVTVTDEDLQKFYDAEKDKKIVPAKPETGFPPADEKEKEKDKGPDPVLLSAEKRVVKYVYWAFPEDPKDPEPPPPSGLQPPVKPAEPVAPVAPDTTSLPEDQKKAKEEEFAKQKTAFEEAQKAYPTQLMEYQQRQADHILAEDIHLVKTSDHSSKLAEVKAQKDANEKTRKEITEKVANFSNALVVEDGEDPKDFDAVAKEHGLEVKVSAAFAQDAAPEGLKDNAQIVAAIFKPDQAAVDLAAKAGDFQTLKGEKGYAVLSVQKIEAPAVQPLDAIKDKLKEKLTKDKVDEALKKAAEEYRTKLAEAIKGGKNFADAVAAAGPVAWNSGVLSFSQSKPIDAKTPNGSIISQNAAKVNAGDISEPLDVTGATPPEPTPGAATPPPPAEGPGAGKMLVFVEKKEIMDIPDRDKKIREIVEASAKTQPGMGFFSSSPFLKEWLAARRREARDESVQAE